MASKEDPKSIELQQNSPVDTPGTTFDECRFFASLLPNYLAYSCEDEGIAQTVESVPVEVHSSSKAGVDSHRK